MYVYIYTFCDMFAISLLWFWLHLDSQHMLWQPRHMILGSQHMHREPGIRSLDSQHMGSASDSWFLASIHVFAARNWDSWLPMHTLEANSQDCWLLIMCLKLSITDCWLIIYVLGAKTGWVLAPNACNKEPRSQSLGFQCNALGPMILGSQIALSTTKI